MSSVERYWTGSMGAISPRAEEAITVVSNGSHQITDGTIRSHGISLIPELDLDYLARRLESGNNIENVQSDCHLNYTYQNINGLIRKNSLDLLSGTSNTPIALGPFMRREHLSSPHWTPPLTTSHTPANVSSVLQNVDFTTNIDASSSTSPLSQYLCQAENNTSSKLSIVTYAGSNLKKRTIGSQELYHCQPAKKRVSSVGSLLASSQDLLLALNNRATTIAGSKPTNARANYHIAYPRLSEMRYLDVITEAQHQNLNLDAVRSVLNLLTVDELDTKLKFLAKCVGGCSLSFDEFTDSRLDDMLVISELANLNAYSLQVVKNTTFSNNHVQKSPMAFLKDDNHLKEYFDNLLSSGDDRSSPFALYKNTFRKVFSLLSFINSISAYLNQYLNDPVLDSNYLPELYDNLNSDTISNIRDKLNFNHHDSQTIDNLISIMWVSEDSNIKRAFAF